MQKETIQTPTINQTASQPRITTIHKKRRYKDTLHGCVLCGDKIPSIAGAEELRRGIAKGVHTILGPVCEEDYGEQDPTKFALQKLDRLKGAPSANPQKYTDILIEAYANTASNPTKKLTAGNVNKTAKLIAQRVAEARQLKLPRTGNNTSN